MATKAKKRVHPMPKLGWKDQIIYWITMILTGGFSTLGAFIVLLAQDDIAFSDPAVIARTVGQGNLYFIWLLLWCLIAFILILAGLYQRRIPILGRSDIKYGPPAYPRVYPIFLKNKPKYWVSPKELHKQKRMRLIVAVLLIITFLVCAVLFSLSFYGRAVLCNDGSITVYNAHNQEIHHYLKNEIVSVELDTYHSRSRHGGSWHIHFKISTADSKSYNFAAHSFEGTDIQQLQTMSYVKEQLYKDLIFISGTENLQKVVWDQYSRTEEKALLYQLFELTP